MLIGFSGLSVGDEITVPGEEITTAVKRFLETWLVFGCEDFGNEDRGRPDLAGDPAEAASAYLAKSITTGSRKASVRTWRRSWVEERFQVTPNVMDRAKIVIQKFFDGKGFKNVDVEIEQKGRSCE